ncbi:MAG: hypothetical protein PHS14_19360 [Elusimicrobia bacterium]|nr:hypothetical protein [Elusimicrobiota bacterium]
MRLLPLAAVLLPLLSAPAFAAFQTDAGVNAAQFLKIGAGARSLGMGEALTASAEGPEAMYWNPGGLAAARGLELAYTRAELPASVHHDYAALALPVNWAGGVFGIAFTRLSQGAIDQIDNVGVRQGSFAPHSEAVSFGYARSFIEEDALTKDRGYFRDSWNLPGAARRFEDDDEREPWTGSFRAGGAIKVVSETLGTRTATTASADGGVIYRPSTRPALALAWAFRNAGGRLRYIRESEPLPFEFSLAAAHDWEPERGHVVTALEAVVPLHARPYGKLGAEWEHGVSKGVHAIGRVGFQGRSAPDLGFLSGLTVGAGCRIGGFSFDLAFQPLGDLGEAFRLSLGWKFGRKNL